MNSPETLIMEQHDPTTALPPPVVPAIPSVPTAGVVSAVPTAGVVSAVPVMEQHDPTTALRPPVVPAIPAVPTVGVVSAVPSAGVVSAVPVAGVVDPAAAGMVREVPGVPLNAIVTARGAGSAEAFEVDSETTQRFLTWLEEQGATTPALKMGRDLGSRGAFAKKNLLPGELVIHVPRSAMITTETAKTSEIGKKIASKAVNVSDYGYLGAFLLDLKRQGGGFWKPYLDMIPTIFPNHPIFFLPDELEYLRGSYCLPLIEAQRQWASYDYHQVNACLPPEQQFGVEEFSNMRCAVMTRVYGLQIEGKATLGIVPLADMFNHAWPPNTIWTGEATYGFSATTSEKIEAGHPLYESYGRRCNGRLFAHHGFCIDNNPDNEAEIALAGLPPIHPFLAFTKDLGFARDRMRIFRVTQDYNAPAVRSLFSFLRMGCLEDMPAVCRMSVTGVRAMDVPPISRQNEVGVLSALMSACEQGLKQFKTSLDEDERLLQSEELPLKMRFAVMVGRGEKRILKHYFDLAQTAIPLLQNPNPFLDFTKVNTNAAFGAYFAQLAAHLGKGGV